MAASRVDRRLAAILAADVVGYSRLMERDEAGTLARLKAHRKELIEPLIAEHHGRIVKLMGDGALVRVRAASSTRCAAPCASSRAWPSARRTMPEDERIRFRIGINLGDVILEDGDLYGDGVNIAARLEQLAEPGGIVRLGHRLRPARGQARPRARVCRRAAGQEHRAARCGPTGSIRGLAAGTAARGQALPAPARRWRSPRPPPCSWSRSAQAAAGGTGGRRRGTAGRGGAASGAAARDKRLASRCCRSTNLSGDARQERLADGITEDLITELARYRELLVIARNSSFAYKGKARRRAPGRPRARRALRARGQPPDRRRSGCGSPRS